MSDTKTAYASSHNAGAAAEPGGSLLGHIWASIAATLVLGVICCGIYPLVVYAIGQVFFPIQANGSLVKKDGTYTTDDSQAVGSALIGQNFSAPEYFHPRPSAAGSGYDGTSSGGTNLGPLSDKLINGIAAGPPATAPATPPTTTATASMPTATVVAATTAATTPEPTTVASAQTPSSGPPAPTFDGVRLRVIHYALDNGIAFKLYTVKFDDQGNVVSKTPVPLTDPKYFDKDGNPLDNAMVDAFPHNGDPADKTPLIATDFSMPIPADAVTASASGLDPHISPKNAAMQKARIAKARHMSEDAVQKLIELNTDHPGLGILGDPGVNVLILNIALDKAAPMPAPASVPATPAASASAPAATAKHPA